MNLIFRRAATRVLILTVIAVVITLAFLSNRLFHNLTSAVEQNQFDLMRTILRSSLRAAEDRAIARGGDDRQSANGARHLRQAGS